MLLAPDGTCNLAFGSVFIVLPTSKDLTQVRAERNGSTTVPETPVYPNLSELCLSPSVGICAEMMFGWVLQKGAVTRHPKFQVMFCYESVIKVLVV